MHDLEIATPFSGGYHFFREASFFCEALKFDLVAPLGSFAA